ncbi:DUF485 domain-containing protein [Streptomyces sp. BE147]|uniref:DUF485 domain-containing protein n=1 Tax=Streptomyces sp. BE147 TaxID=3002524 RepID=UPI002E7782A2|nr:DUF485 domain-containing protein [Streptomyces sp. BE147]MEE1738959.1 DUF485 domain-containing protein [Streptomyces sp. BE147]
MPTNDPHPPPYQHDYLLPWQSSPPEPAQLPSARPLWPAPCEDAPAAGPGQASARLGDLRRLRAAYRVLRRVATFTALSYFVLFLVLSAYVPELMTRRMGGGLTLGLLMGLGQLPVIGLAIRVYERTAERTVDPLSEALHDDGRPRTGAPAHRRAHAAPTPRTHTRTSNDRAGR